MRVEILKIPNPFPHVKETNSYLINRSLMIDTGVNTPEALKAVKNFLKERDLDFSIDVIVTHPHVDHFGLACFFENVYAHKQTCERLVGCAERYFKLCAVHFKKAGVPSALIEEIFKRYINIYTKLVKDCDKCVEIKDKVKVGDDVFDVLHTPGHTYGHIVLYHRETESIFCGDIVLENTIPNPVIEPIDEDLRHLVLEEYISTVEKLYELDVRNVYPGHGSFKSDFRSVLKRYVDRWMEKSIEIWNCCKNLTPFEIAKEIYGLKMLFLAVSEVLAYLDFLQHNGFVEVHGARYKKCGDLRDLVEFWNDKKLKIFHSR